MRQQAKGRSFKNQGILRGFYFDLLPNFCGKTPIRVLKNRKKRRKNGENLTIFAVLVEVRGFEPLASALRTRRSTN